MQIFLFFLLFLYKENENIFRATVELKNCIFPVYQLKNFRLQK